MKTSNDYRRQFCDLQEEVKQAIIDLMQSHNLSEIELDEETSLNHQIGYYSDLNGWMGAEIAKIEIINDILQLTTNYEDELFNDNIPADEWVNILGAVEDQIEKSYDIEQYINDHNERVVGATGFGYGIITSMEDDNHWSNLILQYGYDQIHIAVTIAQKCTQFSFADQYFYFDCEGRYIKSFNTIEDIKNHFETKNE